MLCVCGVKLTKENTYEEKRSTNLRSLCKACFSKDTYLGQLNRDIEKDPSNFMACDDCDNVFKKRTRGRITKLKTNCPHCNSINIYPY